jgi:hypothetical protein
MLSKKSIVVENVGDVFILLWYVKWSRGNTNIGNFRTRYAADEGSKARPWHATVDHID